MADLKDMEIEYIADPEFEELIRSGFMSSLEDEQISVSEELIARTLGAIKASKNEEMDSAVAEAEYARNGSTESNGDSENSGTEITGTDESNGVNSIAGVNNESEIVDIKQTSKRKFNWRMFAGIAAALLVAVLGLNLIRNGLFGISKSDTAFSTNDTSAVSSTGEGFAYLESTSAENCEVLYSDNVEFTSGYNYDEEGAEVNDADSKVSYGTVDNSMVAERGEEDSFNGSFFAITGKDAADNAPEQPYAPDNFLPEATEADESANSTQVEEVPSEDPVVPSDFAAEDTWDYVEFEISDNIESIPEEAIAGNRYGAVTVHDSSKIDAAINYINENCRLVLDTTMLQADNGYFDENSVALFYVTYFDNSASAMNAISIDVLEKYCIISEGNWLSSNSNDYHTRVYELDDADAVAAILSVIVQE